MFIQLCSGQECLVMRTRHFYSEPVNLLILVFIDSRRKGCTVLCFIRSLALTVELNLQFSNVLSSCFPLPTRSRIFSTVYFSTVVFICIRLFFSFYKIPVWPQHPCTLVCIVPPLNHAFLPLGIPYSLPA